PELDDPEGDDDQQGQREGRLDGLRPFVAVRVAPLHGTPFASAAVRRSAKGVPPTPNSWGAHTHSERTSAHSGQDLRADRTGSDVPNLESSIVSVAQDVRRQQRSPAGSPATPHSRTSVPTSPRSARVPE